MRINEFGPRSSSPPYNELFTHFGEELYLMCRERAFDAETYIEMPEAEKEIQDFAKSGSTNVCVVVGAKGIGKTSVLNHLLKVVWPKERCAVLPIDLRGISYSEELADCRSSEDALKKTAESLVEKELRKCISNWVQERINEHPEKFTEEAITDHVKTFGKELVPVAYWMGRHPPIEIYKAIAAAYPVELERLMFFVVLRIGGFKHAKIVVDNLDDKDWRIVMGFSEALAHLREYIAIKSRIQSRDSTDSEIIRVTPILACRPITFWTLKQARPKHSSDWYGMQDVRIGKPSSLGKILRRRYDKEIAGGKKRITVCINNKEITIDDRDKLFRRICSRIEQSGQAELLLQLANYDMADAMAASLEVLRNRHFVKTGKLLACLLASNSKPSELIETINATISRTVVLRSLAYGNQSSDAPVYPVANTRVPNVIIDNRSHLGKDISSIAKPMIVSYLMTNRRTSSAVSTHVPVSKVLEFCNTFLKINEQHTREVIDELYDEGLITHPQGIVRPSFLDNCELELSPRLICIWEELQSSSVLLQAYRESMELPIGFVPSLFAADDKKKPHLWFIEAAYSSYGPRGEVLLDLVMIVVAIRDVEIELYKMLKESGQLQAFQRLIGTELVCHRLAQGLLKSLDSFWVQHGNADSMTISRSKEIVNKVLTVPI
jgi:hypothetical protein